MNKFIMPKNKLVSVKKKLINTWIDEDSHSELMKIARSSNCKISLVLREMIYFSLNNIGEK